MRRRGPVLVVDNERGHPTVDAAHVAVCVATLEGFGRIISRFGSAPARFVMQEYVHRLESILRDGDQLIQINESKYCLLLKNLLDPNHALLAGRKLEEVFASPYIYLDTPVRLEVRAGIATGHGTHGDAEILFRAAEAARETAVAQRIVWAVGDPLDVEGLQRNWRLGPELQDAIEAHRLRLYYQPQVACTGGQVTGAEGLLRWEHRDGLLTPEQFLPHLDASGMVALTGHVIQRGVADLLADPGMPQLAVNLPATQLLDPLMLQSVLDELSLWKVDPERLTLELSEEGLLENAIDLMPALRKLRDRGVRIMLDDCGAGRGSLRQFRELPIDGIKLDRSFVAGLHTDPFDAYVIAMLIEFAHFLHLEVVAKGVESMEDIERLAELGCDHVQGFAVSPPLSVDAFAEWRDSRELTPDS